MSIKNVMSIKNSLNIAYHHNPIKTESLGYFADKDNEEVTRQKLPK